MTALHDFVTGDSPQIDPEVCAEHRIGYDRVWRVAVVLFSFAGEGSRCYPGRSLLAERAGMDERPVRTALLVLERSGVIRRQEGEDTRSTVWVPTWEVTGQRLLLSVRKLEVDPEACKEQHIGEDRAWRVAVVYTLGVTSTAAISKAVGFGVRQVRAALRALGLTASRSTTPQQTPQETSVPYDIFSNEDRTPDDSTVPTKKLHTARRMASRPGAKKVSRHGRDIKTWSPFDMAYEFQWMVRQAHPRAPGDLGDARKLGVILAKMRKDYGHDARVEMYVLDRFLDDRAAIYERAPQIPIWRKYLASFKQFYADAEAQVSYEDPTYTHFHTRHAQEDHGDPTLSQEDLQANREYVEKSRGQRTLTEIVEEHNRKMRERLGWS